MIARLLVGAALVASCVGVPASPPKAHDHVHADVPCADACHPWVCEAAWSVTTQADAACDEEGDVLCVCRAP